MAWPVWQHSLFGESAAQPVWEERGLFGKSAVPPVWEERGAAGLEREQFGIDAEGVLPGARREELLGL